MPHIPDSRHADHDLLAIAAYAAGDATGSELETARDLLAACAECAALHADLRAIAAALPALPAPARPRDFTLSPEQAASLRPAGWRRLLAPLAGPRFAFAGPLGGGLATLGVAGLLIAGSLGAPVAGTGAAGAPEASSAPLAMEAASPVASGLAPQAAAPAPAGASGAPSERTADDGDTPPAASPNEAIELDNPYAVPGDTSAAGVDAGQGGAAAGGPAASVPSSATGVSAGVPDEPATVPAAPTAPAPLPVIAVVGLALLAAGVALAGLRFIARRAA